MDKKLMVLFTTVAVIFTISLLAMNLIIQVKAQQPVVKAFVYSLENFQPTENGLISFDMRVVYSGAGIQDFSITSIKYDPSTNLIELGQNITNAIIADANSFGYSLVKADMIIPEFQKGI